MGVSIRCEKTRTGADLTYIGFARFRKLVAECCGPGWALHYKKLLQTPKERALSSARAESDEELDAITADMIRRRAVPVKIVDFLLQPDEGGRIHHGACRTILRRLERRNVHDDPLYGYAAWGSDATRLSHVMRVLRACVESKSDLTWSG